MFPDRLLLLAFVAGGRASNRGRWVVVKPSGPALTSSCQASMVAMSCGLAGCQPADAATAESWPLSQ